MSIGSLVTTLLSGWTSRVERHGAMVIGGAAIWGLAILALGFAQELMAAVICLAIAGAADAVSTVFRMTIWNETIPPNLRGRLAGVEMISYLSGPYLGNARWMGCVDHVEPTFSRKRWRDLYSRCIAVYTRIAGLLEISCRQGIDSN